jgi:hypothetical protein
MGRPTKRKRGRARPSENWSPPADVKRNPSPRDTPEERAEKDRKIAAFLAAKAKG